MLENVMLRKILELKNEEVAGGGCITKSYMMCTPHQILLK
jgi:hypothetical protein